jgi:hypothetical protein
MDAWLLDENHSETQMQRAYAHPDRKAAVQAFVETLPFVSSFTWTDTELDDKTISDVVVHLYLLVTFDDGKIYPVSLTGEKGEIRYHTESAEDLLSGASNLADVLSMMEEMLEVIMQSVTIS